MAEWINPEHRLPEFPSPDRDSVYVIAFVQSGVVIPMCWSRNRYAKTERGRAPRWEAVWGGITGAPRMWMPMPDPPHSACTK